MPDIAEIEFISLEDEIKWIQEDIQVVKGEKEAARARWLREEREIENELYKLRKDLEDCLNEQERRESDSNRHSTALQAVT